MIRIHVGLALEPPPFFHRRFTFPEARLHPRKQVAWANWMISNAALTKQDILIETFSDFILSAINCHLVRGTIPLDMVEAWDEGGVLLPVEEHGIIYPSIEEEIEYLEEAMWALEAPPHEQL
jgi:hypothetical protein